MTAVSPSSSSNSNSSSSFSSTSMQWEAVGSWQGGTAVAVTLADTPSDASSDSSAGMSADTRTYGLLASAAGVYGWSQPGGVVKPVVAGINDLNIVAVTFAGGLHGPATAFAATASGRLYRTTSGFASANEVSWQEVSSWAGLGVAVVLAPSPVFDDDQTLFVGTPTGFYRTQDGGLSWESCNFGLLDEEALCMVCAPTFAESETLWAGTAGGGLYRSRNSARAWRESGNGLPDAAVQALAVSLNFSEDQTLFVGMEAQGIYVSRDGGASWTLFALAEQSVNALACTHEGWLWAGTEDGLWRVRVEDGAAEQVAAAGATVMSVAATSQGRVAFGLYGGGVWLTDDGTGGPHPIAWQQPDTALHAPPVVTSINDKLFALDADGVIARSPDGGAQWIAPGNFTENVPDESPDDNTDDTPGDNTDIGLPAMAFALDGAAITAPDGTQQAAVYAALETGLARWDAATERWSLVAEAGLPQEAALGVTLSPTFGEDQAVLTMGHNGGHNGGQNGGHNNVLRLSQDGGVSWQTISGPWAGHSLLQAHFAPEGVKAIVALTVQPTETGHFALTVWHSSDTGQSWEVLAGLSSGVPAALLAWPHDDTEQAIFLATQHRVIKLFQQGTPPTLQVYQHFFDEALRVTALAPAPNYVQSQIVWAATSGGLYRSIDRGTTWALMLDLPQALPVVWLEVTMTHVNAMTLGGRVWRAAL